METSEKTFSENSLAFLVLVPHRDCLPALEAYRKGLFAAGFDGAYAYPAVAPLALLTRPLAVDELKSAAAEIRRLLGDKAIDSREQGLRDGWGSLRLFGPMLDLPLPNLPGGAVLQRWERPVLAPAILAPGDDPEPLMKAVMEDGPEWHTGLRKQSGSTWMSTVPRIPQFRAAALANLALTPVTPETTEGFASFEADYSFSWEQGPLHWLPRNRGHHVQTGGRHV